MQAEVGCGQQLVADHMGQITWVRGRKEAHVCSGKMTFVLAVSGGCALEFGLGQQQGSSLRRCTAMVLRRTVLRWGSPQVY